MGNKSCGSFAGNGNQPIVTELPVTKEEKEVKQLSASDRRDYDSLIADDVPHKEAMDKLFKAWV